MACRPVDFKFYRTALSPAGRVLSPANWPGYPAATPLLGGQKAGLRKAASEKTGWPKPPRNPPPKKGSATAYGRKNTAWRRQPALEHSGFSDPATIGAVAQFIYGIGALMLHPHAANRGPRPHARTHHRPRYSRALC